MMPVDEIGSVRAAFTESRNTDAEGTAIELQRSEVCPSGGVLNPSTFARLQPQLLLGIPHRQSVARKLDQSADA